MAGLVTVLSPCILPLLPIVLSSGVSGGKKKPLGVMTGFVLSFSFFTLFLAQIVQLTGLSADWLRNLAALVIFLFGLVLVIPKLNQWWEMLASRLANRGASSQVQGDGFVSGILVGVSLGLVWAPCVGPILASVITLAATGQVSFSSVPIVLAYSLGTALPMLYIIKGSRKLLQLTDKTKLIQVVFGWLMVLTAMAIYFGWDRSFQAFVLDKFPNYGVGLTKLEDNQKVQEELKKLETSKEKAMSSFGKAPGFEGGGEWINSETLSLEELEGKVVLVDFWTYSCVNCIRTLPYLKAWDEKYKDKGLMIVGVHSPEFEFEKDLDNVKEAVKSFEIKYPVVLDNDFLIWRAYSNRYWPAKYLIDKQGKIRYTHFGEGKYQETEAMIQELLEETGELTVLPEHEHETQTPETYLGYWRIAGFVSPEGVNKNQLVEYSKPNRLGLNKWAFEGKVEILEKHSQPTKGSKLFIRFLAKEVNLVMKPKRKVAEALVRFDDQETKVVVDEGKLYNLISLDKAKDLIMEIEFLDDDMEVYAFTFG